MRFSRTLARLGVAALLLFGVALVSRGHAPDAVFWILFLPNKLTYAFASGVLHLPSSQAILLSLFVGTPLTATGWVLLLSSSREPVRR